MEGAGKMGDGLKRASDYANPYLAPFLRDVKAGGIKEVTDRYLLTALGWIGADRSRLPAWVKDFAQRHRLIVERDNKQERWKFIRATF
jgi:hypothetical protein